MRSFLPHFGLVSSVALPISSSLAAPVSQGGAATETNKAEIVLHSPVQLERSAGYRRWQGEESLCWDGG